MDRAMDLFPELRPGLLNGWLFLGLFYGVFGVMLISFPKNVVGRLYERSNWRQRHLILNITGKLTMFSWLILVIFTPLKIGNTVFIVGTLLYSLGLIGFVIALLNYKNTPLDQPVTSGLYRISRNPQQATISIAFFGISMAIGSWLAVVLIIIGIVLGHKKVLAEEEMCLKQYGASYKSYMEHVPRYFLFF